MRRMQAHKMIRAFCKTGSCAQFHTHGRAGGPDPTLPQNTLGSTERPMQTHSQFHSLWPETENQPRVPENSKGRVFTQRETRNSHERG